MSERSAAPSGRRVLPVEPASRWAKFGYIIALLQAVLILLNWGEPVSVGLYLVTAGCWLLLAYSWTSRRIELAEDELRFVSGVWTCRTAYTDIIAVSGDVPERFEWSERLVVERRGHRLARRLYLPARRSELAAVKAEIELRVATARSGTHGAEP